MRGERRTRRNTPADNDTVERMFILSDDEVERLFTCIKDCVCSPYAYLELKKHGQYHYRSRSQWWLRTPSYKSDFAAMVNYDGDIVHVGFSVDRTDGEMRPVMWIMM